MGKFILRRLLLLIPILLGLTVIIFLFIRLLPGDPASAILGERATPESLQRVREALGLDRPLFEQYWEYVSGVVRGDLGTSFLTNRDVVDDFLQRFPATVELSVAAMVFALSIGIPLGMLTAKRRGTWIDQVGTAVSLIGISIPIFFLGLMLKWLFAIQFPILPDSGRIDLIEYSIPRLTNLMTVDALLAGEWGGFMDALRHLILPGIALGTIPLAVVMRITRASVIDVLNEDYVRTALAKGLMRRDVVVRHALRNALIPAITVIGTSFAALLGGAVVTETVFTIPGMGRLVVQSIGRRDYPIIQGAVMTIAITYVLVNLLVDILYIYADPRVRLGGK